jgi:acetyl esterase
VSARLDGQAQDLLDVIRAAGLPPLHSLSVEQARARMRATHIRRDAPLALSSVHDARVPTPAGPLRLRVYRPQDGELPLALFIHGGGWTINDIDTHDDLCRRLARRSGWLLASLNYRRAPEHKHPAALQDAYHAYRWLLDNAAQLGCDTSCRAVIGESSGATTAAALSLLLRDCNAPAPTLQVIAYPVMDMLDSWPSYAEHGSGYVLDREQISWFFSHFMPTGGDPESPYLLPLRSKDLSGVAPALLLTAEFDPLRDEGIAYAQALANAGVAVEHVHADDQMHGFLMLDRIVAKAGRLVDRVGDTLAAHSVTRPQGAADR